jgi:hypothetical protein
MRTCRSCRHIDLHTNLRLNVHVCAKAQRTLDERGVYQYLCVCIYVERGLGALSVLDGAFSCTMSAGDTWSARERQG